LSPYPRRKHRDVIEDVLSLRGARVADIGCGDGSLVRLMTRLGAHVTGIDPSLGQLLRARAAEPADDEAYVAAGAECVPLPNASLDIAVFFNSLHHVPVELQAKALEEAARALKPGGLLYVMEPMAEGPNFQATRLIDDETEVRTMAYAALQAVAAGPLFRAQREITYATPIRYDSFAQFRNRMIAVDERRRAKVEALEEKLRAAFEANSERRDDAFFFDQPCRLNLLRRT